MVFGADGSLAHIAGTKYDFVGKADYLRRLMSFEKIAPYEILFVGNSCNDIFASQSGARHTLCESALNGRLQYRAVDLPHPTHAGPSADLPIRIRNFRRVTYR